MHFRFALELSNINLWNIDLLDTHLDLLDTDIPSKYFVCLNNVFKTSSRHVFKTFSRHVFNMSSRRFQDISSGVFRTYLQTYLQRNNFTSSRRLEDVFKVYLRRLQDVSEEVKSLRWRRVEDIFKACLLGYMTNGPF